jgi:peptidoglycan/LPS O-acetylase OafA/YrhL
MQAKDFKTGLVTLERVPGWDLLRGMCAFAVASYHLMFWQDVAAFHTLGSYGVYLFFVLSGASLAYNYIGQFESGQFSFSNFLRVRYWRLAPLYLALMLVALPWKVFKDGFTLELAFTYLLNATFLFGFFNPSVSASLVGGWSLGIEAIFYLVFPWLMLTFRNTRVTAGIFILLLGIQICWIALTLDQTDGDTRYAQAYFQAPAFAAYFMGGCVLGVAKRNGLLEAFQFESMGLTILFAGFALMLIVNPVKATHEILGWRGVVLGATCFSMVYASSRMSLKGGLTKLAVYFGDATYGLYLLHPVLFFGLVQIIFPRLSIANPVEWTVSARLIFGCLVIGVSFWLALLSERLFERPVRHYFKRER